MNFQKFLVWFLAASVLAAQTRAPITLPKKLFGWADLHAHPASHLAFGADGNGNGGMFWGKPGSHWYQNYSGTTNDMPRCSYKHGGTDLDVVRHETHKALMQNLDALTDHPHQTADFGDNNFGGPSFDHWPHARGITHQQMHITQIRRAYDGGQRLMVASVTDNEFLSDMWTKIAYNAGGNPVPAVDPDFGYESAKRQIQFIKGMAYTNPEWMEIAFTAAQARKIIDSDKLAIILSVEMDSLSAAQVIKLVEEDGVRQVIPIHLVNNNFGGTAVYSDAFNAVNNFLHSTRNGGNLNNDGFMHVVWDPKMSFRLGRPSYPRPEGFNLVKGGAINIDPVPNDIWAGLRQNYEGGEGGHRNWRGLSDNGQDLIKQLAKKGVLIDVAHMSARSMRDSLDKAQEWNYPMMDSHTGFRAEDGTAESERSLHRAHAKIIGDLGGVIGLGTDWPEGFAPLIHKKDLMMHLGYTALIPGDPNASFWYQHTWDLPSLPGDPEVAHLKLRITTGRDSLTTDLHAIVTIDGKPHTYLLNKFHEGWRGGLVTSPTIELPAHAKSSKVTKITLKVDKGAWWSLRELEVQAVPRGKDPVSTWLSAFKEGLAMMDGKGMAIGTDINGFAPQLWLPADDVQYPIQIAHNIGPARHTPILQKSQVGSRTFSFKQDGIAHYGMLPDFFEALSQQPGSSAVLQALFHSVDDVVTMWEKCEKEGKKIK